MKSNGTKCKTRPMSRHNFHVLLSDLYNVQIGQTCVTFSRFSIRGDKENEKLNYRIKLMNRIKAYNKRIGLKNVITEGD